MLPLEYIYARGKLGEAVELLVIGQGDVRERIAMASGPLFVLSLNDLPPEQRKDWQWIVDESTKFGPCLHEDGSVWCGAVQHTMRRVKRATASKIAQRIWSLYGEMNHIIDSHKDSREHKA